MEFVLQKHRLSEFNLTLDYFIENNKIFDRGRMIYKEYDRTTNITLSTELIKQLTEEQISELRKIEKDSETRGS